MFLFCLCKLFINNSRSLSSKSVKSILQSSLYSNLFFIKSPNDSISCQPGIFIPPFIVIDIVGAVGKTNRMYGYLSAISCIELCHPAPVSPSP